MIDDNILTHLLVIYVDLMIWSKTKQFGEQWFVVV
jgi:hypothetical protein